MSQMQFGIFTVSDITEDPTTGHTPSEAERIRATLQIAKHAEEVGLDVFALGEHHNPPFWSSSPTTTLAYIAGQIASVKPREKGHREFLNQEVQADFEPHDLWNCGIKRALKFMKDRVACPTDDPSTAARLELTCSQRGCCATL